MLSGSYQVNQTLSVMQFSIIRFVRMKYAPESLIKMRRPAFMAKTDE